MRALRWALGTLLLVAVTLLAFGFWIAEPWAEHRGMRSWPATLSITIFGGDEKREGLAEVFRNWDQSPPYSRLVAASQPHEFPRKLRSLDATYEWDEERYSLDQYLERARVQGLLVMREGEVVFEIYPEQTGPEDRYHLWSASKSFTGTLIGIALYEGRIESLDDRIDMYAKQFRGTAYGEASIRDVMRMSSGVDFFHHQGFPERNWMYLRVFRLQENLDDFAAELKRRVPSGTDFNYLAPDTHVLSAVLRGAYDKRFVEIVQEKLWDPVGFGGDAIWSQNVPGDEGVAFGHCCLATRLIDFAHLGELYHHDGVWNGRRLLPKGWAELAGRPGPAFQEPNEDPDATYPYSGYAMQFWVPPDYDGEFYAAGAFGQYLWIDIENGVSIAQFASQLPGDTDPRERNAAFRAIVEAVRRPDEAAPFSSWQSADRVYLDRDEGPNRIDPDRRQK